MFLAIIVNCPSAYILILLCINKFLDACSFKYWLAPFSFARSGCYLLLIVHHRISLCSNYQLSDHIWTWNSVNPYYSHIQYLIIFLYANIKSNPKISTHGSFVVISGHCRAQKNLNCPTCTFPAELNKAMFWLFVSVLRLSQVSFPWSLIMIFHFALFLLLLMISLFEMARKWSAEVLSSVSKCKRLRYPHGENKGAT